MTPATHKIPKHMTMLAIIGNIATLFSNLEWQMSNVLAKLIDTSDNSIAGSFLADDLTLSKTTQLIQKLTRYRFVHADSTIQRITELCNSVDKVRVQRNLFIHGMWNFKHLDSNKVGVLDMKWKENPGGKSWSRGHEQIFTQQELADLAHTISKLFDSAGKLCEDLHPNQMTPHFQQKQDAETHSPNQPPPHASV